jgi:rhamnogalacturonyl hydrolase YesR
MPETPPSTPPPKKRPKAKPSPEELAAWIMILISALAVTLVAGCRSSLPGSRSTGRSASGSEAAILSDAIEPEPIRRAMTVVADWQLAHPSVHRPDEWHGAPFWAGLVAFAPLSTDRQTYLAAARANGERNAWRPGPEPFLADDHAITQSYFMLYALDGNPSEIEAALMRFEEVLRRPVEDSLEFSHEKAEHAWVWCDALFMAPPALALATRATGDRRYADHMSRLWWNTTAYLYDRDAGLYYRDSRFFARRERNGAKVFWSRGNGWALAGLARVLQYLPADYQERPRFVTLFQELAQTVAALQGADGYWRASLLAPDSWPGPETSGTALFTYALAWGLNAGLLDHGDYAPVVRRGWWALVRAVGPDGKLGYVQSPDEAPGETGPDQTEIYGTGAFLLAGSEVYRLAARTR